MTWVAWTLLVVAVYGSAWGIPDRYVTRIRPQVARYIIPKTLAGVQHMEKAKKLTPAQRRALAERGFVVVPDTAEQMFMLYEEYGEDEAKGPIPNFITVDSVLQAYHICFDFALRHAEQERLVKLATELTHLGAGVSVKYMRAAPDERLREAAARNLAYFLVARSLLTGQEPSVQGELPQREAIVAMARAELDRIRAHEGRYPSAVMGRTVHYDQFVPRGHYTRSPELGRYFQAMMWYGTVGFELDGPREEAGLIERHCLQALLLVKFMAENEWGRSLWTRIYEPTAFFVGGADDLTWRDYLEVARQVYGRELSLEALARYEQLEQFIAEARRRLPAPRIAPAFLEADEAGKLQQVEARPQGRQMRFMGQRFIPDSYVLQQLVYPLVGQNESGEWRYWPMGLDVMAALGSRRARALLLERYRQGQYANYEIRLAKVTRELAERDETEWTQNLYWAWLNALRPLLEPKGEGYPTFMRSGAWLDKELMTALGSWAQLRHDTILYGKPSGAEAGGPEEKRVQGYVEPYPEVFGLLGYLAYLTKTGLRTHGLLSKKLDDILTRFGNMLTFLKQCAEKELSNQPLTTNAYDRIQSFGGELERLTLDVVESGEHMTDWWQIENLADRHMATIADIHTSFGECLEVGVGPAFRIYVIVPHPSGWLQLTKGGVMSYYEFRWPVADRLTDEKWIAMLTSGKAPPLPSWTDSFVVAR